MKKLVAVFCSISIIIAVSLILGCGGGGGGSNPAASNTDSCSISGKIVWGNIASNARVSANNAVANAKVYLEEAPGYSTMTRDDGSYTLTGFQKGNYHIVAKYESSSSIFKMRSESIDVEKKYFNK